ncbi:uncharacterized protein LOC116341232 [Contarinia nasturtii]|uniref:uncharacterized protein LOC116341232 n=1 Tax=Contarinia nasturtii TaxID=265458 RepID=UPI0012D44116|nr:uncharacterized protein LOC116341232 [Contarinia nasturtii]
MKQCAILMLLSLLLVVQIDCKDVTCSTFLDQFYAKASKQGFDFRPRLSVILGITNDSKRIIKKCQAPIKEFVDHTKLLRLQNTIGLLKHHIVKAYEKTIETRFLYDDIIRELEFKLPIKTDKIFRKSYEKWEKDSEIDKSRLEFVNNTIGAMALDYSELHKGFKEHLEAADQTKVIVEKYFDSANTSFDTFLNITPDTKNKKCIIWEVAKIILAIQKEQDQLLVHLESMKNILRVYNEQRLIFIEYIMGMRESLIAGRDEVEFFLF